MGIRLPVGVGVFLTTSLAATLASCASASTCPAVAWSGIAVVVQDATNGASICDATVTLRDGSYVETATAIGGCSYAGAFERSGTYDIEVSKVGFRTAAAHGVVVTKDTNTCPHVVGKSVVIALAPM